jgi:hypothetical protein
MHYSMFATPKRQATRAKYILVLLTLLSLLASWHSSAHVVKAESHCQLCLSEVDLEHYIPTDTALFQPSLHHYFFLVPIKAGFRALFFTSIDIRGPPFSSITKR